jgi:hypothetical protein
MPPGLLALVLVLGVLALVPARRLARLGWSRGSVGTYFLALWAMGFAVATAPGGARILVPLLLVVWIAPFVTWRTAIDRMLGRPPPHEPPRNVTPPEPRDESR